jgi:hypothetical protein
MRKLTKADFIEKARSIHNGKYLYFNIDYKNLTTPIKIVCYDHGSFSQTPHMHLTGRGCPKCGYEMVSINNWLFWLTKRDRVV